MDYGELERIILELRYYGSGPGCNMRVDQGWNSNSWWIKWTMVLGGEGEWWRVWTWRGGVNYGWTLVTGSCQPWIQMNWTINEQLLLKGSKTKEMWGNRKWNKKRGWKKEEEKNKREKPLSVIGNWKFWNKVKMRVVLRFFSLGFVESMVVVFY